jgi:signal transduction histidine kinase
VSFDTYQPIHYIWFYLMVIAVLEGLAVYIYQFRGLPGARPLFYCQVCKSLWLLGLVISSISPALPQKMFWISLEQIMAVLFPYLWLLLITELSRGDQKIPRMLHYIFGGIVSLLCLTILTNSWSGLHWSKVWLHGQVLTGVKGPMFHVAFINSYLLNTINYGLTITWFFKTKGLRRRQALLFMIMPLFSWAGHMVNLIPGGYIFEPEPSGFLLAGLYITWFFYRWRVINILPHAQEAVVRNMIDGLLIVDEEDYIVALNPAAQVIFDGISVEVGGKFQKLVDKWPALALSGSSLKQQSTEAAREYPDGVRYYQINITPLNSEGDHFIGKVFVLKDITRQKQDHTQLLEHQKALAVLTERERLGREIHDGQGQIWGYLQLQLQTVHKMLSNSQIAAADEQVNQLLAITKDLHTDVRESITGLKNVALADWNFTATLQEYLEWYEKNYDIAARLTLRKEATTNLLDYNSEVQLLRIVQEALTNIRKHAKARHVEVIIQKLDGKAVIRVVDDGCGFEPANIKGGQKYGLQIMQERAEEAGGHFTIESKPGTGTTVTVQFDLEKAVDNENTTGG